MLAVVLDHGLRQIIKKKRGGIQYLDSKAWVTKKQSLQQNKDGCLWGEYLKIYGKVILGKIQ